VKTLAPVGKKDCSENPGADRKNCSEKTGAGKRYEQPLLFSG